MRNLFLTSIIVINIILWGCLIYYFKQVPLDNRVLIRDREKITELNFYKYSFYDSAKFIFRDECIYVNPPDYDSHVSYYDNRPFNKSGTKTVILTKNSRLHIESLKKLLRRETVDRIYVPFGNLDFEKNSELNDRIKEKDIYFRFYFDIDQVVGENFKIRFVYPFRNTKRNGGGFILSFLGRKLAFFSNIYQKDKKKVADFLEREDAEIVKLPLNGNLSVRNMKPEYIVVHDDLADPAGIMKLKHHLFYSRNKKKIFRTMLHGNIRIFIDERKFLFYSEII